MFYDIICLEGDDFCMRKFLVLILIFVLVGCTKETTTDEGKLIACQKAIEEVTLSGIYYTVEKYRCEYEEYSFEYAIQYYLESEEIYNESIILELEGEELLFIKDEGSWIINENHNGLGFDTFKIKDIDKDWFIDFNENENEFLEKYNYVSDDDKIIEIHLIVSGIELDRTTNEDIVKNLKMYIDMDENENIVSVYYSSFPSYEVTFLECDEEIELPETIIDYIQNQ